MEIIILNFGSKNLKFYVFFFNMQDEMETFTTKIVDLCKEAKLFAPQGGPIIFAQVSSKKNAKSTINFRQVYKLM